VIWLYAYTLFPSSPVIKLELATHRNTEKRDNLWKGEVGKGVGEEPNHTTVRNPGPL
jgi:hypothetical protein